MTAEIDTTNDTEANFKKLQSIQVDQIKYWTNSFSPGIHLASFSSWRHVFRNQDMFMIWKNRQFLNELHSFYFEIEFNSGVISSMSYTSINTLMMWMPYIQWSLGNENVFVGFSNF